MYAVVLILNKTDMLTEVVRAIRKVGLTGATILDSVGIGRSVIDNFPSIASGFKQLLDVEKPRSKTILMIAGSKEMADKTIKAIEDALGDISRTHSAIMFTVPIENLRGLQASC